MQSSQIQLPRSHLQCTRRTYERLIQTRLLKQSRKRQSLLQFLCKMPQNFPRIASDDVRSRDQHRHRTTGRVRTTFEAADTPPPTHLTRWDSCMDRPPWPGPLHEPYPARYTPGQATPSEAHVGPNASLKKRAQIDYVLSFHGSNQSQNATRRSRLTETSCIIFLMKQPHRLRKRDEASKVRVYGLDLHCGIFRSSSKTNLAHFNTGHGGVAIQLEVMATGDSALP